MQRRTAEIDGEAVAWHEQGSGVPVVLIHGIPTGPALWRRVVPLVEGARCLAFEMAGYADSMGADAGRDISVAAQAARIWPWLDALGIERAVLVGHDLGGGVAQIAAVRHRDRCAGLVLTNAIGYDSWPIPSVKAMRAAAPGVARLPDQLFRPMLGAFTAIGHDDRAVGRDSAGLHWEPYGRHGGAEPFVRQIRSVRTSDTASTAAQLPTLGIPARVVWGVADPFQKIEYGERFARALDAPLTRIEGAKHFVPEDHPEPVAAAINELVATAGGGTVA